MLVNPEEEDIEKVFDKQVNEKLKGKTLVQLKKAKVCADNISNNVGVCIKEIEEKVIFEEPLPHQFKRIFKIEMPNNSLSVEEFYKFIAPVLKLMKQDDITFFYEHYGGLVPQGYHYKYYF